MSAINPDNRVARALVNTGSSAKATVKALVDDGMHRISSQLTSFRDEKPVSNNSALNTLAVVGKGAAWALSALFIQMPVIGASTIGLLAIGIPMQFLIELSKKNTGELSTASHVLSAARYTLMSAVALGPGIVGLATGYLIGLATMKPRMTQSERNDHFGSHALSGLNQAFIVSDMIDARIHSTSLKDAQDYLLHHDPRPGVSPQMVARQLLTLCKNVHTNDPDSTQSIIESTLSRIANKRDEDPPALKEAFIKLMEESSLKHTWEKYKTENPGMTTVITEVTGDIPGYNS